MAATMTDIYSRAAQFAHESGAVWLCEAICRRIGGSFTATTTKDDVTIYWWAAQFAGDCGDTELHAALVGEADTVVAARNLAVVAGVIRLQIRAHLRTLKRRARRMRAKMRMLQGATTNVPEIPAEDLYVAGL